MPGKILLTKNIQIVDGAKKSRINRAINVI